MYLGLGANTRKTVFHSEYVFAEKIVLSSIMTRHRFCRRVFHGHDSSTFFCFYSTKRANSRKRSHDITTGNCLRCALTTYCIMLYRSKWMRASSKELNIAFVFFVLQVDGLTSAGAYTEVGGGGGTYKQYFMLFWVKTKKEMQYGLF